MKSLPSAQLILVTQSTVAIVIIRIGKTYFNIIRIK